MPKSESSEPGNKRSTSRKRRGRMHDAEGTRDAILNAAEEVFAQHGFDGARIDAIAATAGYNKSLIFQYFGDKLGLYAAVVRRADDQTRFMQNEALNTFSFINSDARRTPIKSGGCWAVTWGGISTIWWNTHAFFAFICGKWPRVGRPSRKSSRNAISMMWISLGPS